MNNQTSDIWKKGRCSFNAYFAARRMTCIHFGSWQYKDHFLSHTKRPDNLTEIIKELPEKDLIFLESSIFQNLPLFSVQSGKFICKYTTYPNYVLDLQKDPDFLMDNLSSKSRSTLKRKIKNLKKAFGEDWDVFSPKTGDDMQVFLDRAAKLSEKTYQHKLFDDGIPNDAIFRDKMYHAAENNTVRASLLRINGEDAAYILCTAKDNILIYDYVGYHPDYQNHSVGIILQWLMLSELMKEKKFHLFDFTPGEGQHKSQFSSEKYICSDIFIAPLFSKATLQIILVKLCNECDRLLTVFIKKLGLKSQIKKIMRRFYLKK